MSEHLDSLLQELNSFSATTTTDRDIDVPSLEFHTEAAATAPMEEGMECANDGEDELQLPLEYMVNMAGQNLPELTHEIHSAQLCQETEVERREGELRKVMDQLAKEKERLQLLQNQLCATNKAICLAQDEEARKREMCDQSKKSLSELVSENQCLQLELKRVEEETERDSKLFENYRAKMERHKQRTAEVEKNTPLQLELEALRREVQGLRKEREELLLRDWAKEVETKKEELVAMEANVKKLVQENSEIETQIDQGKEEMKMIQRDMGIDKKRRAAQLIRLQRRVGEAQSRRRQFIEESERLKKAIADIEKIIKETS